MPKLIVQHQGQEWTVELKQGSNVVGRQSTCDIPVKEGQLSRQHCDLVLAGATCIAVDKGSMNGTLVNGKRIVQQQTLETGDKVQVGPVVLWFEKKNVAGEASAVPVPRPAPVATEHPSTSAVATRRAVVEGGPAPADASGARSAAASMMRDYAVRARGGGNAGKIAAALAVAAALVVLVWLAKGFLNRMPVAKEDQGGLVKNGSFEAGAEGRPAGWILPEKPASGISIDVSKGRGGGACLAVDKASGPGDRLLACLYAQDFPLGKNSSVQAEAQVRFETFTGWAALKIDWLREPRGPVVAEEIADASTKCSDWTPLSATFTPPAGAGGFRLGLSFLGRGGRILVDDVSLRAGPGGGPGREHKAGNYLVRPTGQGVLQVALPRLSFFDIQAQLESDKDGALRQAAAFQVTLTPQEGVLDFKGKLLSPVDFHEIEYDQKVSFGPGGTTIEYRFRGKDLSQIDRFSIAMTLPRGTGAPDPDAAVHPRSRMGLRTADGGFILEYSDPARILSRGSVEGRHRIVQGFSIDAQQEDLVFGLRIREEGAGGESDPQRAAAKAKVERRFGEALSLLRSFLPGIKEANLRSKIEADIKSIEDTELREWTEVQAAAFRAGLLRRPEVITRARDQADAYLREWAGIGPCEAKASELREEVAKVSPASDAESDRPRRLHDLAKAFAASGKVALARALLEALLGCYPQCEFAAPARELLKTLAPQR